MQEPEILHHTDISDIKDWLNQEINPVELTADWLEESSPFYFSFDTALSLLSLAKHSLLDSKTFIDIDLGIGNNFYDSLVIIANIIKDAHKLKHAKRNLIEKKVWLGIDSFMATQMTAASTVSLLSDVSVIQTGIIAAASTSLAPFAFAAYLWSATAKSTQKLHRATKKTNIFYLLTDRITKYEKTIHKIATYQHRLHILEGQISRFNSAKNGDSFNSCNDVKSRLAKATKEKNKLEKHLKKADRLKNEIDCLSKKYVKDVPKSTDSSEKQNIHKNNSDLIEKKYQTIFGEKLDTTMTPAQEKLAEQLIENQKEKAEHRRHSTIALTTAALGMTLIGLGFIFPPMMVPGVALCTVSSLFKITDFAKNKTHNYLAKKYTKKLILQELDKLHSDKLSLVPKYLNGKKITPNDQLKWRLAFLLSQHQLQEKIQRAHPDKNLDENVLESIYYNALKEMPASQRQKLLDLALEKSIENKILDNLLGEGAEKIHIDEKDKNTLIKRYSRSRYSFFSSPKENTENNPTDLFNDQVIAHA